MLKATEDDCRPGRDSERRNGVVRRFSRKGNSDWIPTVRAADRESRPMSQECRPDVGNYYWRGLSTTLSLEPDWQVRLKYFSHACLRIAVSLPDLTA